MKGPLYLDAAATTAVAPEVLEAMRPWLLAQPDAGRERAARAELEARIARRLDVAPGELLLLAGGSEANNLAVLTTARAGAQRGRRVLAQPTEHPSVLRALEALAGEGFAVEMLEVDRAGRVRPEHFARAAADGAALAVLMRANNETGVLQPVVETAALLAPLGVPLHVDAVQAGRHEPVTPRALGAHSLTLTAHKLDGPKGVALLAGPGVAALPRPASAPTLPLLAGFLAALERRAALGAAEAAAVAASRDALEAELLGSVPGLVSTAAGAPRLPGHLHLRCAHVSGEALVLELDQAGIAASSGAACATADGRPSHVLVALGFSAREAASSLRLSLPGPLTAADRARVVQAVAQAMARLRALGPPPASAGP